MRSTKIIAIQTALVTITTAEARKASRNFPVRSLSRVPPGAMGLATPFLRHLARPRAAEKMEVT